MSHVLKFAFPMPLLFFSSYNNKAIMNNNKNFKEPSSILELGVQAFTLTSYSIYENTVLIRIFKCCQRDISDAITSYKNECQLVFKPEENAEQMRHVKLRLSLLEPHRSHYAYLRKALTDMAGKEVKIPYRLPSHALTYSTFPQLFTVSFQNENRHSYVILHLKLDVLRRYLSCDLGYHRINLDTYFSFTHFATQQAYRFYYAYFAYRGTYLGTDYIASAFSTSKLYTTTTYGELKKYMLEPARKEMENRYQHQLCEIRFRYVADYGIGNEPTGQPKRIAFYYEHVDDAHPEGARLKELETYQMNVKVTLKIVWGVDEKVAEQLSRRITYSMMGELQTLMAHKSYFKNKMKDQGRPLRSPAGYIRNALEKFLKEKEWK